MLHGVKYHRPGRHIYTPWRRSPWQQDLGWGGEERISQGAKNTAVSQPWPSPPHFVVKAKALDIVPDGYHTRPHLTLKANLQSRYYCFIYLGTYFFFSPPQPTPVSFLSIFNVYLFM